MSRFNLIKNKRGDISKTITWIVATVLIVGVLILFIYISSVMSNIKVVKVGEINSDIGKESLVLSVKTSLAFNRNNTNKEIIENILEEKNE